MPLLAGTVARGSAMGCPDTAVSRHSHFFYKPGLAASPLSSRSQAESEDPWLASAGWELGLAGVTCAEVWSCPQPDPTGVCAESPCANSSGGLHTDSPLQSLPQVQHRNTMQVEALHTPGSTGTSCTPPAYTPGCTRAGSTTCLQCQAAAKPHKNLPRVH